MESYLSIERIRFEDRLAVEIDVDPSVSDVEVPAFLLHPLVENALRYGDGGTQERPLRLRLGARTQGGQLVLEVWNSGSLRSQSTRGHAGALVASEGDRVAGTGIGLSNVRSRLAALLPGRHRFTLAEADGGVLARIDLPLPRA